MKGCGDRRLGQGCSTPGADGSVSAGRRRPGAAAVEGDDLAGGHDADAEVFDATVGSWLMGNLSSNPPARMEPRTQTGMIWWS
jgi:hypothetical protein